MYRIFESNEDNIKIHEAYTSLDNFYEQKVGEGGTAIFSSPHTVCIIRQHGRSFIRELSKKINMNG